MSRKFGKLLRMRRLRRASIRSAQAIYVTYRWRSRRVHLKSWCVFQRRSKSKKTDKAWECLVCLFAASGRAETRTPNEKTTQANWPDKIAPAPLIPPIAILPNITVLDLIEFFFELLILTV